MSVALLAVTAVGASTAHAVSISATGIDAAPAISRLPAQPSNPPAPPGHPNVQAENIFQNLHNLELEIPAGAGSYGLTYINDTATYTIHNFPNQCFNVSNPGWHDMQIELEDGKYTGVRFFGRQDCKYYAGDLVSDYGGTPLHDAYANFWLQTDSAP